MLIQTIEDDFKAAMKAKDQVKVDTLRMLKASVSNYLIEKQKKSVEDVELMGLIQKQVKLRQDAIEGFKKGGRQDLVDKETREKGFLEAYLPTALSDAELRTLVQKAIQAVGAKSKADMGKVIKEAVSQARGRADGRRISELAQTLLPA